MENKTNMIVSVSVVVLVIAVIVFISLNSKKENSSENSQTNTMNQNTTDNKGVKITVLKEGTGDMTKKGDTVAVNYTGSLANGTIFDSNVDPKFKHVKPFEFTLGGGQVIPGWDIGVMGMKTGEKRRLEIKPEYAYGADGYPSVIPPNATLTFEVELLGIKK